MPRPARTFAIPHSTTPVTATGRGPRRSCHRPPMIAPTPRKKIASANVQVVVVFDQPNAAMSGWVKRLQE